MEHFQQLTFDNGRTASAIPVHSNSLEELSGVLQTLGLTDSRPTLVLIGGASGIQGEDLERLRSRFLEVIAPLAETLGAYVVDGGTDAGIMRLMGQARTAIQGTFPLIGVVAIGTAILPQTPPPSPDAADLESNHTHFVLVPGNNWGDESPYLAWVASLLSQQSTSVSIVVNGGEITWQDALQSVKAHRPIVVLAGSGRTADKIAAALEGNFVDERARTLLELGNVEALHLTEGSLALADLLKKKLSS